MWDNMSGFWRMQCAGDSFDITAKVSLANPNSIQRLSFKYIKNVLALFTLPGPCRERKGVEDILGEIHFCSYIYLFLKSRREHNFCCKTFWMPIGTRKKYNIDHLGHLHLGYLQSTLTIQDTYVSAKDKCSRWLVDHSEHFAG